MEIGDRIKKYRNLKKITQKELAEKVGISKNGLWNYENNKRSINADLLKKIADVLEIPVSQLMTSEQILEDVKSILDQFNEQGYTKISSLNNEALVPSFQSVLLTLGYAGILNYSDMTINQVLFSDEFKDHTFYLLEKYSKEEL